VTNLFVKMQVEVRCWLGEFPQINLCIRSKWK